MEYLLVNSNGFAPALFALAECPQVFQGEDARIVTVAPGDLVGVKPNRRDADGFEGHKFLGAKHAEGVRWSLAQFLATGARTMRAEVAPLVNAAMAVAPLDGKALFALLAQV